MAYKSYKHLSNFDVNLKFSTKIYEYPNKSEKLQIKDILLQPAHCAEQNHGISYLQQVIADKVPVNVEEYRNFKIFRLGRPFSSVGTLYIADENVEDLMEEDLKASSGMLGYWDSNCVCFVIHNKYPLMAEAIKTFLENLTSAELIYSRIFKDTLIGLSIK